MNRSRLILRKCLVAAAIAAFVVESAGATVLRENKKVAGVFVEYTVVLPNNYDASKAYPAVLAFPPGDQSLGTVQKSIEANYRAQAEQRGYIVVMPAAPFGHLFFVEGDRIFPAFLKQILSDYKVLGDKFHAAGNSNGGLSAFHIAAAYPQYFWSVTAFPGFLEKPTPAQIQALSNMCIYMYAGERDPDWLGASKEQADAFRKQGLSVQFSEEKDQPHAIATLRDAGAARLFDQFDQGRNGCAK